jgi:hypothetical protein
MAFEVFANFVIEEGFTGIDSLKTLKGSGVEVSIWVEDIAPRLQAQQTETRYELVDLTGQDLGFDERFTLKECRQKSLSQGFSPVQPLVALMGGLFFQNDEAGVPIRVLGRADDFVDSDGIKHLPKYVTGLGSRHVETYWAWENAVFNPDDRFIVQKLG